MFKITVLTRFVIIPTSFEILVINFPECLFSINLVSASNNDEKISRCMSLVTSTETQDKWGKRPKAQTNPERIGQS